MFKDNWEDSKFEGMMEDFEEDSEKWKDIEVIYAIYSYGCYEGDAFVLFKRDGKLYEVNAGHCSCYGLERQWEPEETSIEELRHRMDKGQLGRNYYDGDDFAGELKQILDKLEEK